MWRPLVLTVALVGAAGCQTFVGIEDVEGHLPYVEGEYLIGIKRARAGGGDDTLRLRGTATIDTDGRSLTMSLNQLAWDDGRNIAENAISGVVFEDGTTAEFDLTLTIQPDAVENFVATDATINARMRMSLEGDFAICAEPVSGSLPTLGSVLVDSETATPPIGRFDVTCDRE